MRRDVLSFWALVLFCDAPLIQAVARAENQTPYIVDGLALDGPVAPKSATYREYKCRPSEQFESFIWCQRRRTENGKFGEFTSVNSILHSPDNTTAYVSRYIEPAYLALGDVEREVRRLSQRFGVAPHILQSPRRSGSPSGVIAYWGSVTLVPLDAQSLAQFAASQSVTKGMLFDFLGNFGDSARKGFPIFQLGGAAGYVWGARFDENGKGALRMTAIDASRFTAPSAVANGSDSLVISPPETGRSIGRGVAPTPALQPFMVAMENVRGVYQVPIRINDTITLDAILDSGATDVCIPADVVLTLIRSKTISSEDFLGSQTYTLADGSEVPSQRFIIKSLKVGNKTLENVAASIVSVDAQILLGQSFLRRFRSWSIDNEKHSLILN
jgi:hypothetical protein